MAAAAASEATKRRRRPGVRPRESREGVGVWTRPEHERFLQAQRLFPKGPWKLVAQFVGTRSTRQTMTHAQKHRQKLQRRRRGLRRSRRDDAAPPPAKDPPADRKRDAAPKPSDDPVASFGAAAEAAAPLSSPAPSPLVATRDPTALLFAGGELRFQDLLLLPSDRALAASAAALCPPPLALGAAAVGPPAAAAAWEEPLLALDALCGAPWAAAPAEPPGDSSFPGLDDALDYIIRSM